MKKEYKAKIVYKMKPTHPDVDFVEDWGIGKEYTFEDVYHIENANDYSMEEIYNYIKSDLRLVAGGGYDSKNIYGEKFEINGKEVY